jgi:ABC-2 type transport system ATP-binding protein
MNAISVRDVYKYFGTLCAVKGVTLDVLEGEFFGLLGPNGAGKTSLINMISGLSVVDSGSIEVNGSDVSKDYLRARRMLGVVPQELVFDPFLSVYQTLKFQSGYFGIKHNDSWIQEILGALGLDEKADSNMRSLSGGMKRRVLVAQALVHRPPVIILDEPTAGVDVDLRQGLWKFIRELNERGHTIVLTTHYLEEAESLCGRIGMLKKGELVVVEKTEQLLQTSEGLTIRLLVSSGGAEIIVPNASNVEEVLAHLRVANIKYDSLQLDRRDLEDVFVSVMRSGKDG